jgi:hypothetical protein
MMGFSTIPSEGVEVRRNGYRLSSLLLAIALWPAVPASAAETASISFAEQPVRLLRDTSFYVAGRGVRLQNGDIVESGTAGIQIEGGSACTIALGPASQVFLKTGAKGIELVVLNGWMKIRSRAAPGGNPAIVSSGGIQFNAAGSSVIVHARPGITELFVEDGEPWMDEMHGSKVLRHTKLTREQYAVRSAKQPLKLLPRPPKEFVGGMPPAFLDALVTVAIKATAPAPKLERPASFADVAPWVADEPALRQALQHRFDPPKPAPAAPSVLPSARPASLYH